MKKEFIVCSAIYFNDGRKSEGQPKNIDQGFVVCGRRHHNCYSSIQAIGESLGIEDKIIKNVISKSDRDHQGFITSLDRFVKRDEAFRIAKQSGQIIHSLHDNEQEGILISEDLW